jgi:IS5 family transposase
VTVDQESEILRNIELTAAAVYESTMFLKMLNGDEQSVFADKAYCMDLRKTRLRKWGIFCGIPDKNKINQPLSIKQMKRNKRFSKVRSAVERVLAPLSVIME